MAVRLVMPRIIAAAAVILLAGCASQQAPGGDRNSEMPGTRVDSPEGYPNQATWLPDGWIYYVVVPPDVHKEHTVYRSKPGGKAEQVTPANLDGCRLTRWSNLHELPDGRLGMSRLCMTQDPTKDFTDLVAYSPETGKLEVLAKLGFTFIATASWASDLKSGYAAMSDTVCAAIAPINSQGVQRFPAPVKIDGHEWRLDAEFFRPAEEKCDSDGRVQNPVVLADGKSLLMLGSPESQGRTGTSRSSTSWNIYRWTPGGGAPTVVAKGFGDPNVMKVVPGERFAVLSADRSGKRAIWAVDLKSGAVQEIAAGNAQSVAVSPDGSQLVGIFQPSTGDRSKDLHLRELRLLDLSKLK